MSEKSRAGQGKSVQRHWTNRPRAGVQKASAPHGWRLGLQSAPHRYPELRPEPFGRRRPFRFAPSCASCRTSQSKQQVPPVINLADVLVTDYVDSACRQELSEVIEAPHQVRDKDMRAHCQAYRQHDGIQGHGYSRL
jgi:hypothetical protein